MVDYRQKLKPAPSQFRAGFGAVATRQKPEDWQKVRKEVEEAMAGEVAAEHHSPNTDK
jgi:hypothetical protein